VSTIASRFSEELRVYDLAQPFTKGMPHSANHPGFMMSLIRRHGDTEREDGSSSANEMIVTGGHVGTHIDALAHVSHHGLLHGGISAAEAQKGGLFTTHGIEQLRPIVRRGVLLDAAAVHGVNVLPGEHAVSVGDLVAAEELAGTRLAEGDVALVRTGWSRFFGDPVAFLGHDSGVPGPDETAAGWLADRGVHATGSDTTAFEHIPPQAGHRLLPAHRLLLVERGIPIMEMLSLDELAADGVRVFGFIAAPLRLVGATGSPIRPLAIVER
jgi:kynurenine formamidase